MIHLSCFKPIERFAIEPISKRSFNQTQIFWDIIDTYDFGEVFAKQEDKLS